MTEPEARIRNAIHNGKKWYAVNERKVCSLLFAAAVIGLAYWACSGAFITPASRTCERG
jgi:hypothetical protein